MVGTSFSRRLMMAAGGAPVEPAPEGVVWYKRLIFDSETTLNTGLSCYQSAYEWEVKWTRTIVQRDIWPFNKRNYGSNREMEIEVRQYYGPVSYAYFLYTNSRGTGIAASPAIGVPSTFVVSRAAAGGDYTLTVGDVSTTQSSGGQDYDEPLMMSAGAKEVLSSIIRINGVEVQRLRPCTYNGEPGMWDTINDMFFGNASESGTFTVAN